MSNKHECKAAVVTCMDFRLHGDNMGDFLKKEGVYGEADMICVAGGVLPLVAPDHEKNREFILKLLGISKNLHHIENIYLINHTDCGAYKSFGEMDSKTETDLHKSHLGEAEEVVKEQITKGTQIEITKVLAEISYPDDKLHVNFRKI